MSKRLIATIFLAVLLAVPAAAQAYQAPEVKISQDKVRVNGKSYYAHVVTERQTLYSISKAYNVSLKDIYDSNKNLDLENAGLKVGQVIFIPTKPSAPADVDSVPSASQSDPVRENAPETASTSAAKPVVIVPYPKETVPEEPKKEVKKEEAQASTGSSALDRWLFPGKGKQPVPEEESRAEGQPASVPAEPDSSALLRNPVRENAPESGSAVTDSVETFVLDIPERIKVAVVLPFTSSRLSDNTVDFYSGLLLAARDLGNSGLSIDIDAIDVRDSASISPASLAGHDVIIGPITSKDMQVVLGKCPEEKLIISPLDPQSLALTRDFPSIQAPTPTSTQNEDIVHWAIEDMQPGDSLVLITSKGAPLSEGSNCIIEALKGSGVRYHTISYGILEGLQIQKAFEWHCSANGTTRYIVAADDESFVNDAVRNVNLMMFKKHDVALYAPSRIRSFNMIETEYLHSVNTHISAAYFADFENKNVSNFIMAYRALYNAEPNQFAFHGYDTLHFFINIVRTYGRQWPKVLQDYSERGLQTDFRFVREEGAQGFVNTAVRRVVYTPEYKIVLQ